jgi:aspartate/methionine/tyrosine aminotransferase
MNFFNQLFTKTVDKKTNKQNAITNFLNNSNSDYKQWFSTEDGELNFSKEVKKSAIDYVGKFDLEKSSKTFNILPELRLAISKYFVRCNIKCDSKNVVIRANIFDLLQDLYDTIDFEDNKKILFALPIPSYFVQQCHDNQIGVLCLNANSKDGYKINFTNLKDSLANNKVKILFLNYPNSTAGIIMDHADAIAIATILQNNKDLLVVIDESLREMVLDDSIKPTSLASIDNIASQIITISSLKYYGLGNLDIAFACLRSKKIIAELFCQTINISYSNQQIIIAALLNSEDNQKHLAEIARQCRQNFSLVSEEIDIINQDLSRKFDKKNYFIKPLFDEAKVGNSILLNFSGLKGAKDSTSNKTIETDLDMAEFLKRETNIIMMPGQHCLLPAEEIILRLYLLKSKQEIRAGFKKIRKALTKLKVLSKKVSCTNLSKLKTGISNVKNL